MKRIVLTVICISQLAIASGPKFPTSIQKETPAPAAQLNSADEKQKKERTFWAMGYVHPDQDGFMITIHSFDGNDNFQGRIHSSIKNEKQSVKEKDIFEERSIFVQEDKDLAEKFKQLRENFNHYKDLMLEGKLQNINHYAYCIYSDKTVEVDKGMCGEIRR